MLSTNIDITDRKHAEEDLRRYAKHVEALAEMSRTFVEAGLDHQIVLNTVAQRTAVLIGDACVITLFSQDQQRAFPVAFNHRDTKALQSMEEGLLKSWQGGTDTERYRSLLSGESIHIPHVVPEQFRASLEPEFWPYFDNVGISSVLIVPLQAQGRVIGTLGLTRDRAGSPYTHDDQVLLQGVADLAALTIQNSRLFQSVQEHRERLKGLSTLLIETQETERRRIARELHDDLGQLLTAVKINLETIEKYGNEKDLPMRVQESVKLIERSLDGVRDLAVSLRPWLLDTVGLIPSLRSYIHWVGQKGTLNAKLRVTNVQGRFPPAIELACFRIVQESLTNVLRHAHATDVNVTLSKVENQLEVAIADNGVGFDFGKIHRKGLSGTSLGLLGIEERANLVGGTVEIETKPGAGTTVRARFPVTDLSSAASDSQDS